MKPLKIRECVQVKIEDFSASETEYISYHCSGAFVCWFVSPTWLCLVLFQSSAMGNELPKIALLLLL